jgi:hypothetical protein
LFIAVDEEVAENADADADKCNAGKGPELREEVRIRHRAGLGKGGLNEIVERPVPRIDRHADLNLEIGDEDDEPRSEDRPAGPRVRRKEQPEATEQQDRRSIV